MMCVFPVSGIVGCIGVAGTKHVSGAIGGLLVFLCGAFVAGLLHDGGGKRND